MDESFLPPAVPGGDGSPAFEPPPYVWQRRPKFQDRRWLHLVLLLLTIGTTTLAGTGHYLAFLSDYGTPTLTLSLPSLLVHGLWYSVTILAILGCHELGHYFACRYYDVDASLPFFLPVPFILTGTLGAFIRIREPIPSKRQLFDIGIAGPIAGFVDRRARALHRRGDVARRAGARRLLGMRSGRAAALQAGGEAPVGHDARRLLAEPAPDGVRRLVRPARDGAQPVPRRTAGRRPHLVCGARPQVHHVTIVMIGIAVVLTYFSWSWIVWTVLMIGMLVAFGPRHPRTIDEDVPLDRTRLILAVVALVIFALCFTPMPMEQIGQ